MRIDFEVVALFTNASLESGPFKTTKGSANTDSNVGIKLELEEKEFTTQSRGNGPCASTSQRSPPFVFRPAVSSQGANVAFYRQMAGAILSRHKCINCSLSCGSENA
jgi:hypothetical protein